MGETIPKSFKIITATHRKGIIVCDVQGHGIWYITSKSQSIAKSNRKSASWPKKQKTKKISTKTREKQIEEKGKKLRRKQK